MLLTSELVTRAVQHSASPSEEVVELRVWMPGDVVRVEVRGNSELLCLRPEEASGTGYELLLLDSVADRWSVDSGAGDACMWFEIDRHPSTREVSAGV